jgi:pentatricopeptide repeat protein
MISGFVKDNNPEMAEEIYNQMLQAEVEPDEITFTSLMTACAETGNIAWGRELQKDIDTFSIMHTVQLDTALLNLFTKTNCLDEASAHFNNMKKRGHTNTTSWNTLLSAYVHHDQSANALHLYTQMQKEDVGPNETTFNVMLDAAGELVSITLGKSLHAQLEAMHVTQHTHVLTSLIKMYSKW